MPTSRTTRTTVATAVTAAALLGGSLLLVAPAAQASTQPSSAPIIATFRITGTARATATLILRSEPGPNYRHLGLVPNGTTVSLTGARRRNGMAQIAWQGTTRWVNARYLAPTTGTAPQPAPRPTDRPTPRPKPAARATGQARATADLLVRSTPGADFRQLGLVRRGEIVQVTGERSQGRAQILWHGQASWVTAKYLAAANKGVTSSVPSRPQTLATPQVVNPFLLPGATPAAKRVAARVLSTYPQISTIYGVRIEPGSDHYTGRAADVMLPNYRSNQALGWQIASYMRAHADELGISYVIFQQKIWSVARAGEGWRPMADRGGDTANHMDHVHISVR